MDGISDIKIVGIDDKRPPRIRKEPYIDLFFRLSHKPPLDWSRDFKELLASHPSKPKVDEKDGLFINAWVRTPDEIVALLETLKTAVTECSRQYIERIETSVRNASADDANMVKEETGEQGRLNKIIAGLEFDSPVEEN